MPIVVGFQTSKPHRAVTSPGTGFREHDRVALTGSVEDEDGRQLPSGAEGTIVSVGEPGRAYLVEFTQPLATIVVLRHDQVHLARP